MTNDQLRGPVEGPPAGTYEPEALLDEGEGLLC